MKCLYNFEESFVLSAITGIHAGGWMITNERLADIAYRIKNTMAFKDLKEYYKVQGLSDRRANKLEIVTWLDSLTLMSRVIDNGALDVNLSENIKIIMEYQFEDTLERIDYLLLHNKNVILLEFGKYTRSNFNDFNFSDYYEKRVNEKIEQLNNYEKKFKSLFDLSVNTKIYPVVYLPEYELRGKKYIKIKENIIKNRQTIEELVSFINNAFQNTKEPTVAYNLITSL